MDTLSALALKFGQRITQVIELAIRELEEKTFWAGVHRAFEESASDPVESARQRTELAIWERASETDFRIEPW
jgi:maltooligosyltrehalose synthase